MDEKKIKTIILLTDFSEPAKNAIRYAIQAFGEEMEYKLVNAYYARSSSATLLDLNDLLASESEQGLKNEKAWIFNSFPHLELKVETFSVFGGPVDAIRKVNKISNNDLVVMGTKGASGMKAVLFGSVASTVMRATKTPVISVPPIYEFVGLEKIVFARDGKVLKNLKILNPIKKIQQQFESRITLFTVGEGAQNTDFEKTNLLVDSTRTCSAEGANVAKEVTEFCKEENAHLLVVLPRHTGFFDRLFHKSVSKELIELASLPILSLENES
jgi:nucleotide-binding universal stress UspA family protein